MLRTEGPRLLMLTAVYRTGYGVGHVIRHQIEALSALGLRDVSVGTLDTETETSDGVFRLSGDPDETARLIRRVEPDVVIAHSAPFYSQLARLDSDRLLRIAYDHGEPFPSFFEGDERARREREADEKQRAFGAFDIHVSISDFIRRGCGRPSVVNYNGAEHDWHRVDDTASVRNRYGIPRDAFTVLCLSRIGSAEATYKGFDLLLETRRRLGARIASRIPDIVLVGRAVYGAASVRRRLDEAGVRVICDVSESDKIALLSAADVFFSPSLWEGFNLPLIEAQSLGLPSVCFSVGAHPEVSPIHFPSIDAMIPFLEAVARDPAFGARIGGGQRRFVRDRFTWANNARRLKSVIERALSDGG